LAGLLHNALLAFWQFADKERFQNKATTLLSIIKVGKYPLHYNPVKTNIGTLNIVV